MGLLTDLRNSQANRETAQETQDISKTLRSIAETLEEINAKLDSMLLANKSGYEKKPKSGEQTCPCCNSSFAASLDHCPYCGKALRKEQGR